MVIDKRRVSFIGLKRLFFVLANDFGFKIRFCHYHISYAGIFIPLATKESAEIVDKFFTEGGY